MDTVALQRSTNFHALKAHAWLHKVWDRLSEDDLATCIQFLADNAHMDKGAFEMAVNRMYMDKDVKPRRWKEIQELLLCANSALPTHQRAAPQTQSPRST